MFEHRETVDVSRALEESVCINQWLGIISYQRKGDDALVQKSFAGAGGKTTTSLPGDFCRYVPTYAGGHGVLMNAFLDTVSACFWNADLGRGAQQLFRERVDPELLRTRPFELHVSKRREFVLAIFADCLVLCETKSDRAPCRMFDDSLHELLACGDSWKHVSDEGTVYVVRKSRHHAGQYYEAWMIEDDCCRTRMVLLLIDEPRFKVTGLAQRAPRRLLVYGQNGEARCIKFSRRHDMRGPWSPESSALAAPDGFGDLRWAAGGGYWYAFDDKRKKYHFFQRVVGPPPCPAAVRKQEEGGGEAAQGE